MILHEKCGLTTTDMSEGYREGRFKETLLSFHPGAWYMRGKKVSEVPGYKRQYHKIKNKYKQK